ncbi:MAG TPA: winged helix DNA-binding domain-containing protein, partial [Candidatus Limnocylindrales bacterium]
SAALAIALRSKPPRGKPPAIDPTTTALRERRLVRSWAMRGTLHLFAADDVPTMSAALGGKDNWRRPAWLRWFGVTEPEMDALIDAVGDILDDGRPRTRAELAEEITTRHGEKQGNLLRGSWGSALKVASDRHYLVQSSEDESGVRFVKASRWIAAWRDEDPIAALATLVQRYLAAYGPATLKEILRWWGVSVVKVMQPIVESLGDALTEVDVDGTRAYVRTDDLAAIEATRPTHGEVHLVGGFDPFIVGAGLREHLIQAAHLKRVSRSAGWISPVVLVDGRAAGVWDSARSSKGLTITIDPFAPFDRTRKAAVEAAAERVAKALGAPATVTYGRVFTAEAKGPKLTINPGDA